jgi:hypothetical protein
VPNLDGRVNKDGVPYKLVKKNGVLKRLYGISMDEYTDMLLAQGNACALCGKSQDEYSRFLHVDHDHATGRIRGLLCHVCNVILGVWFEDEERFQRTMEYLDAEHRQSRPT